MLSAALEGDEGAARDLLVLAVYSMARFALVRKTTRGGDPSRKDIAAILRRLLADERGIRQLHRIVVDGREGRRPRRVGATGRNFVRGSSSGEHLEVTETFLRAHWGDAGSRSATDDHEPSTGGRVLRSPEAQLMDAFEALSSNVDLVVDGMDALLVPLADDGDPLILRLGLVPAEIDALLQKWDRYVAGPLSHYRYIAQRSGG